MRIYTWLGSDDASRPLALPGLTRSEADAWSLNPHVTSAQKIFLVHPRGRNLAPKLGAFVDFVVPRFQPPPWE